MDSENTEQPVTVGEPGPVIERIKAPKKEKVKTRYQVFREKSRRLFAFVLWTHVFVKIFIFDYDVYLFQGVIPEKLWILEYRFPIFILISVIYWLLSSLKDILFDLGILLVFPFWFFYILAKALIKVAVPSVSFLVRSMNWTLRLALLNMCIDAIRYLKFKILTVLLFAAAVATILYSSTSAYLAFFVVVLVILLAVLYIRTSVHLFKPTSIYSAYSAFFAQTRKFMVDSFEKGYFQASESATSEKKEKKWREGLQFALMGNRACVFLGKRLKDYLNSGVQYAFYAATLFFLVAVTVAAFTFSNIALYKIDPFNFETIGSPTGFDFFYYSFQGFLFSDITDLRPLTHIAKSLNIIESVYAIFLLVIFASLLLPIRGAKQSQELETAIKSIEAEGAKIEQFILEKYGLTVEDAIENLRRIESTFVDLLNKMFR